MKLLLNPRTRADLKSYLARPSHALLITGPNGAGKGTIAASIVTSCLKLKELPHQNVLQVQAPNIAAVREVQEFLKRKTPGQQTFRRAVILEHFDQTGHEAQNALLKVLEEPPADTIIILCASNENGLLATIRSRVQLISWQAPSLVSTLEFFSDGHSQKELTTMYHLSGGLTGLLTELLSDSKDHPLVQKITVAKELFKLKPYERLLQVDQILKTKEPLSQLLDALQRLCYAGMLQSGPKQLPRWQRALKHVLFAQEQLAHTPSQKLLLDDLLLAL